jgi:hypothetical protein
MKFNESFNIKPGTSKIQVKLMSTILNLQNKFKDNKPKQNEFHHFF